jgi:ABC-type sugar transport system ATPase subunit
LSTVASPLFELKGVCKSYPGVTALQGVDFILNAGEIHALLGENGAGKSTLVKIVSGVERPDAGALSLKGVQVEFATPRAARERGIAIVPQDIWMVPALSIGRNILLGMEGPWSPRGRLTSPERARVTRALRTVGVNVEPETPASALSVPQLRLAQVARSLLSDAEVIVLDEPTAVLAEPDAEQVLERLASLRDTGRGILYVTHRISEVMRIADRITLLRNGRPTGHFRRGEVERAELVALLTKDAEPGVAEVPGPQTVGLGGGLEISGLAAAGRFAELSFTARGGEIVGLAGVQGAGQSALLRAISGLDPVDRGSVRVAGSALPRGDALAAFRHGVRYAPADRRREGIIGTLSISDNLALSPRVRRRCRRFGLRWADAEREMARQYVRHLDIRPSRVAVATRNLSGGNQQKVVVGRILESEPQVLLVEEPTQGVDLSAKRDIHRALRELAAVRRCAIIVASSDFEELMSLTDVIHVMRGGELVARLPAAEASYADLLAYAL